MKLNLEKMQLLLPQKLDAGIFQAIVSQVKAGGQGLIFDTDLIKETTVRDLAVEVGNEYPETKVSAEDENVMAVAARVRHWFTWQNGRRLSPGHFNTNRDR